MLCSSVYLGSLWDPHARLTELPVALVHLDQGTKICRAGFNLGEQLTERMATEPLFVLRSFANRDVAANAVCSGVAYFAWVVPEDHSAWARRGCDSG